MIQTENTPPRPVNGGDARATRFFQWVWDSLKAMRIHEVKGGTVTRTPNGITISIKTPEEKDNPPTWI